MRTKAAARLGGPTTRQTSARVSSERSSSTADRERGRRRAPRAPGCAARARGRPPRRWRGRRRRGPPGDGRRSPTWPDGPAASARAEADRDPDRGHHRRGDRQREHLRRERGARPAAVGVEDEQVGEVRAGQEERRGVGHEDAAEEERLDRDAAAAGGEDQHRGEEDDRGVEVEDGGDDGVEEERRGEQREGAARQRLQPRPTPGEEPVAVGDQADHQQPRDEDEGRPGLVERRGHRRASTRTAG